MNSKKSTSFKGKISNNLDKVIGEAQKGESKQQCIDCSENPTVSSSHISPKCIGLQKETDGSYSLPPSINLKIEFPLPDLLKTLGSPKVLGSPASVPSRRDLNGLALLPYEARDLHGKIRTPKAHPERTNQIARERKLRLSASTNNTEMVEKYLNEQTDPNATDPKKRTALHVSAAKGYAEVVKLLLQYGADPNQKDSNGNTPLHLAACTSHFAVITILLKAGTDIEECDNAGYSPLHLARSRLQMLRRDKNSSSDELRDQVTQIVEMMQTYLTRAGNSLENDLFDSFSSKLSISNCRQDVEDNLDSLLKSLKNLNLSL